MTLSRDERLKEAERELDLARNGELPLHHALKAIEHILEILKEKNQ